MENELCVIDLQEGPTSEIQSTRSYEGPEGNWSKVL